MKIIERKINQLSSKFDRFINNNKYLEIEGLSLRKTIFSSTQNACGSTSIFEPLIVGSHMSYRKDLGDLSSIGQVCSSDATSIFYRNACLSEKIDIEIDILDVDAISASRSDLNSYQSIEEFGRYFYNHYRSQKHVKGMSEDEYFAWCVKGAIPARDRSFTITEWTSLLKWSNGNGSHRFATAWYMAKQQSRELAIKGSLTSYKFNRPWIKGLTDRFDCYVLSLDYSGRSLYDVFKILDSDNNLIDLSESSLINYNADPLGRSVRTYILMIDKCGQQPQWQLKWLEHNLEAGLIHKLLEVI